MIQDFNEVLATAIIQTKVVGAGIVNGTWTDSASITGAFTQSTGTKSIINQGDAVTINAMFHYEGAESITENDRLKISTVIYDILYIQNQKDLETMETVQILSLRRLK